MKHILERQDKMSFITNIKLYGNTVSIYRSKSGKTMHVLNDKIADGISRIRTVVYDSTDNPIKCNDIKRFHDKVLFHDVYTKTSVDSTKLKRRNQSEQDLPHLKFSHLVEIFFK